MPAHKKLLPRPCPQCGLEYGGMQFVIFNPKYSNSWRYNKVPYVILRISHYSKEKYNSTPKNIKKNRTKIWHNFRVPLDGIFHYGEHIRIEDIFNQYELEDRTSITMSVNQKWFEMIQKRGWPLWILSVGRYDWRETRKAHFINKGGLKICEECNLYFKELKQMRYPKGFAGYSSSLLCNECYNVDKEKLRKWKIEKKKITLKIQA